MPTSDPKKSASPAKTVSAHDITRALPGLTLPLPSIVYRSGTPPGHFTAVKSSQPTRARSVTPAFREHARGRHNG